MSAISQQSRIFTGKFIGHKTFYLFVIEYIGLRIEARRISWTSWIVLGAILFLHLVDSIFMPVFNVKNCYQNQLIGSCLGDIFLLVGSYDNEKSIKELAEIYKQIEECKLDRPKLPSNQINALFVVNKSGTYITLLISITQIR